MSLHPSFTLEVAAEHYEAGQYVFNQGDLAYRICFIIKGRVEILHTDGTILRKMTELGPGQLFGEMAVLIEGQTSRLAAARAIETLDVISIPKQDINALVEHLPALREAFKEII